MQTLNVGPGLPGGGAEGPSGEPPATDEEKRAIMKQLDTNPEFRKEFMNLMQEWQDPKYREEQEEYYKQLEREQKEEQETGKKVQCEIVIPEPAFCVRVLDTESREKVYLNICSSDKIEVANSKDNPGNPRNACWEVPCTTSKERSTEHKGKQVRVFDATFHPDTIKYSEPSVSFLAMMLNVAIEMINEGYQKHLNIEGSLGNGWRRKSKYKSMGRPGAQTVQRKTPIEPKPAPKPAPKPTPKPAAPAAAKPAPKPTPKPAPKKAPEAAKPLPPVPTYSEPKVDIIHKEEFDLANHTNAPEDRRRRIPKSLEVRINVPLMEKGSEAALDLISSRLLRFECEERKYRRDITLPYDVEEEGYTAKFSSKTHILRATFLVVPPEQEEGTEPEGEQGVGAPKEEVDQREAEKKQQERAAEKALEQLERKRAEDAEKEKREREARLEAERRAEEEARKELESQRKKQAEEERAKEEARQEAEQAKRERELQKSLERQRQEEAAREKLMQSQRDIPLTNKCIFELD